MVRKIGGLLFILIGIIIAFKISTGENETDKVQKMMIESLNNNTVIAAVKEEENLNQDGEEKVQKIITYEQVDLQDLGEIEKENNKEEESEGKEANRNGEEKKISISKEIICIGIIEIPKIDLKVAIAEGATLDNLKYSVAHYGETAAIGEVGNCAIAGHRSYAYNEFFNRLDEIEVGDEIKLSNGKEQFVYEVYDTFVVEPSQVEVLEPSDEAELTLITCTPIRVATHRLIIKAKKL